LPHRIVAGDTTIVELPISTTTFLGRRFAYCGGGYLRLAPLSLVRRWIRQANQQGQPVVLYIHPRDIDPDQPRLPMPRLRRFKSYVGLEGALDKLNALVQEFPFAPADQLVAGLLPEALPTVQLDAGALAPVS
jgi:hypothetical protein